MATKACGAADAAVGFVADPKGVVLVERDEVAVIYRPCDDNPEAMGRAWEELEGAVGLRGRKFFGTFDRSTGEYRVCAQLRDNDDPETLGLQVATLPGGWYLRLRLEGEPRHLREDRSLVRHTHEPGRR